MKKRGYFLIIFFLILVSILAIFVWQEKRNVSFENTSYYNQKAYFNTETLNEFKFENLYFKKTKEGYVVTYNDKEYTYNFESDKYDVEASFIGYVVISNNNYAAINIQAISRKLLWIINFNTGDNWIVDDDKFEVVSDPAWGPDNRLALNVGDIADLTPCIYNVDKKVIEYSFEIETGEYLGIQWSSDGKFIDCAKSEDDNIMLYRISIDTGNFNSIKTFESPSDAMDWDKSYKN